MSKKKPTMREIYRPDLVDLERSVRPIRPTEVIENVVFCFVFDYVHCRAMFPRREQEALQIGASVFGRLGHISMDGSFLPGNPARTWLMVCVATSEGENTEALLALRRYAAEHDISRKRTPLPLVAGEAWHLDALEMSEYIGRTRGCSRIEFANGRFFYRELRDRWEGKDPPLVPTPRRRLPWRTSTGKYIPPPFPKH